MTPTDKILSLLYQTHRSPFWPRTPSTEGLLTSFKFPSESFNSGLHGKMTKATFKSTEDTEYSTILLSDPTRRLAIAPQCQLVYSEIVSLLDPRLGCVPPLPCRASTALPLLSRSPDIAYKTISCLVRPCGILSAPVRRYAISGKRQGRRGKKRV